MQKSTIKSDPKERNGEPRGDRRPIKTSAAKAHSHTPAHNDTPTSDAQMPKQPRSGHAK